MNVKVEPGAVVCAPTESQKDLDFLGDITIGSMTVIHPKVRILAEDGPIIIGDGNLIEERVCIRNKRPVGDDSSAPLPPLIIGSNNVFEVGAHIEGGKIGDNNVFESKCRVGPGVHVGNGCVVGALCHLALPKTLPDLTVVYGEACNMRTQGDKPAPQTLQLEFLRKMLPSIHPCIRSNKKVVSSDKA